MKYSVGHFIAPFKLIRNKLFFLVFVNGFLLALLVYFYTEDNYESQIFRALAVHVNQTSQTSNTDSILYNSLNLTHNLEKFRLSIFGDKQVKSIKSDVIRPVTFDLMTGSGACGSYSFVLSRLLSEFNIETRFAQMKVDGDFGGHIIIEAKLADKWVAMDASYNLMFKKPEGGFASFQDVKDNWSYYKQQVPIGYDQRYSYSDVRYTNWNKIPVLMPAVKSLLTVAIGKKATEEFSMRRIFLKKFNILFKITLIFYLLVLFVQIRTYKRQSDEIERFRLSLLFPKVKVKQVSSAKMEMA